jgi:hypothetical protein
MLFLLLCVLSANKSTTNEQTNKQTKNVFPRTEELKQPFRSDYKHCVVAAFPVLKT